MVSQEASDPQSAVPSENPHRDAPRLMVDAMLGKLARWLRRAGYDAEFWREGSDDELIAAAREQGRLILTKDHALAGRRGVRALLISAEDVDEQLDEAREHLLGLGPAPEPFTRCGECNGVLEQLAYAKAEGLVPPYVWQTHSEFRRCTRCGRIFWKGTHWPALQDRLGKGSMTGQNWEGEETA